LEVVQLLHSTEMGSIIDSAFMAEKLAHRLYRDFAGQAEDPELRRFWTELSDDEGSHLDFWKTLAGSDLSVLPMLLVDDRDSLIQTLQRTLEVAGEMVDRLGPERSAEVTLEESLTMAYRLEMYMLDSSFQTLFQSLRFLDEDFDPVAEYDTHINRFVEGLTRFGQHLPQTELLAETLHRLWRENKILASQALEDGLTGALNRRGFMTMAGQVCALMRRGGLPVGLIMVDLDRFKRLNDSRGHAAGDRALVMTVQVMRQLLRESDVIGRYGGDEFVILLPDTDNTEMVRERLKNALDHSLGETFGITATTAAAQGHMACDRTMECLEGLMSMADRRLCTLKETAGRDRER